jgi:RNA polymerase sigma-70 factor, ECF subfamily
VVVSKKDSPDDLERYRPYLELLARLQFDRRFQAKLDTSDIVQQTMLQAYRGLPEHRGGNSGQLAAWLRQILARTMTHVVRDLQRDKRDIRKEQRLQVGIDQSSVRLENWLAAEQPTPSDHVQRNELLLELAAAMEKLPNDQREAIELHYWQGWKLAEIATQLDRSVPAVGGLLQRGLKNLRAVLADPHH